MGYIVTPYSVFVNTMHSSRTARDSSSLKLLKSWLKLGYMKLLAFLACLLVFSSFADARVRTGISGLQTLINQARASGVRCAGGGGLRVARLGSNNLLALAARGHAANMSRYGFVSHFFRGVGPRSRVPQAGYRFSRMSEIIFKGSGGASRAMRWWLLSPVHCRAIMNPYYRDIGTAIVGNAFVVVMAVR
jgi:uncharacterized protein YkwD